MPSLTVRFNDSWGGKLELLKSDVYRRAGQDNLSHMVRQLVEREAFFWQESPYIAVKAEHTVLVCADGDIFYQQNMNLELRSARVLLPCHLEMKQEKQASFNETYRGLPDAAERVRSHWLLNAFSVWGGDNSEGQLLRCSVDHMGTVRKAADLEIHQTSHSRLVREVIAGLRDYPLCQHQRDSRFSEFSVEGERAEGLWQQW